MLVHLRSTVIFCQSLFPQSQRKKKKLEEERQRSRFDKVVHDAKHEGLVALLSKIENIL